MIDVLVGAYLGGLVSYIAVVLLGRVVAGTHEKRERRKT